MTSAERIDVALAVEHLRAAECRLADAIAFGDAHEACVEALALIRAAIGPNDEASCEASGRAPNDHRA